MAVSDAFEPSIGKHRHATTLNVVPLRANVLLRHDKPPPARLGILGGLEGLREPGVVFQEPLIPRVRLREDLEHLEQRQEIPPNSAAPHKWRRTGDGVRPDGDLAFIIAVGEQTGCFVSRMIFYEVELEDNVVPRCLIVCVIPVGPSGIEGVGHENSVEPHLVWIYGLAVPAPAVRTEANMNNK